MKKNYDVIVAGAGTSGIAAALSAARNGMSVLLIDKNAYPGGTNTAAMVGPIMTFHSGSKQIIKGIPQEIIDRLAQKDATLGHIPDPIGMVSTITPIDPEILKLVYFEMLDNEKSITTLLHSYIYSVECEDNCVKSVTVVNKNGIATYKAKVFIDATGDGDLAAMCKADFWFGRTSDNLTQPMTLIFTLAKVDLEKVIDYVYQNPEQFILNKNCNLHDYVAVSGFFDLVVKAKNNGDLSIPRDRVLFFQSVHPGEVLVNMTRVTKLSAINVKDLTFAESLLHEQIKELLKFFRKYVPGFEHCYIRNIAPMIGIRESRRIKGLETLTADDVIHNSCSERSVAACAFPIDIHDPAGNKLNWIRKEKECCYDIPYGVMVPNEIKNLLVTGRCISATHEALASARISATAMALGEAAGLAASLSIKQNVDFADVKVSELQSALVNQGAIPGKRWL
ncbi:MULTISPECIES: FAD-dependent oxidoreductase [Tepidanaerobacter]|uniref:FAD-dependent oxidoreductase n=1 Tax=Tepidanaerobacter TaxID=499228 RepID=UPI000A3FF24A|nr:MULTISPECIES: FAD-dependent oxidoreductase [Tepidanaerobacter]